MKPVHAGDTVTCTLVITKLGAPPPRRADPPAPRYRRPVAATAEATRSVVRGKERESTVLVGDCDFVNQNGEVVLKLFCRGVIPQPLAAVHAMDADAQVARVSKL